MYTPVRQLLARKGSRVVTVQPETTVDAAVRTMMFERVGAVIVDDGAPCGIFTETHLVTRVLSRNREPRTTPVREVMSHQVLSVRPDDSLAACLQLMTRQRTRHLLVRDDGVTVGLISIGDCAAHLVRELSAENDILLEYIMGRYPG